MNTDQLRAHAADVLSYAFACGHEYVDEALAEVEKSHEPVAALDMLMELHEASEDYTCSSWDQGAVD